MFGEGDHRGWIGGIRDAIDPHGVSIRLGQRDLGLCTEVQRDIADGAGQVDDELIRSVFGGWAGDRKSTRLNSSHVAISYAVFCLEKKNDLRLHAVATEYNDGRLFSHP